MVILLIVLDKNLERHKKNFFLELTPSLPDDLLLHLSMGELNLPMVSWSGQPMNFIGQLTKKLMKQVYLGWFKILSFFLQSPSCSCHLVHLVPLIHDRQLLPLVEI